MNKNYKELGKFNILNQGEKFENVLLIKNNSPNLTLYYGNNLEKIEKWTDKKVINV